MAAAAAAAAAAATAGGALSDCVPPGVDLDELRKIHVLDIANVKFDANSQRRQVALGRSMFGTVFAAKYRGKAVAIKQAFPATAVEVNSWVAEGRPQGCINIDGVLSVHGVLLDGTGPSLRFYSVMPVTAGSLQTLVLEPRGALAGANTRGRTYWLGQAAGALAMLHAEGVTHGNIKPANIMLSSVDEMEAEVKVADCGCTLARRPAPGMWRVYNYLAYVDPAVLEGGSATPACDVYSWAITAWQVLSGCVPYERELAVTAATTKATAREALRKHVCGPAGQRPPIAVLAERGVPDKVMDLIQQCWASAHADRPSMAAVAAALAAAPHGDLAAMFAELRAAVAAHDTARAAAALQALDCVASTAMRTRCVREGVGVAAKEALTAFADDAEVARAVCRVLHHLAAAAETKVQLVREGAHTAAMEAIRTHTGDVTVVRAACGALQHLAAAADNVVLMVRDGAYGVVMEAGLAHPSDAQVDRAVGVILWGLAGAAGTV